MYTEDTMVYAVVEHVIWEHGTGEDYSLEDVTKVLGVFSSFELARKSVIYYFKMRQLETDSPDSFYWASINICKSEHINNAFDEDIVTRLCVIEPYRLDGPADAWRITY